MLFRDIQQCSSEQILNDGNLLLSVPYDEGWNITVNGTAAELTPAADKGLSSLNVQKGANRIVMTYKTPGALG